MGADGGIKGVAIRPTFLTAPLPELNYALRELRSNIPPKFYFIDDREENLAALSAAPHGYFYSTYGSFQEFDVGDLVDFVSSAKEFLKENPNSVFRDWIEEIYINWDSIWDIDGVRYLTREYLGLGPYEYFKTSNIIRAPVYRKSDNFPDTRISYFVNLVENILDLSLVWFEETWT